MKIELFSTPNFDAWLDDLKDGQGRAAILKRLNRVRLGNWGDCKSIVDSGGLCEMRIDCGPGYRVYYGQIDQVCFLDSRRRLQTGPGGRYKTGQSPLVANEGGQL